MKHILIVDDERGSRESLRAVLEGAHHVHTSSTPREAIAALSDHHFDLVFLDVMMPEQDGISLLREVQTLYPKMPIIMVSASTSVRPVVESMRSGAFDFIAKPFEVADIRRAAKKALETGNLTRQVEVLQNTISEEFPVDHIIGNSPPFLEALDNARKAARTDSTVLICGESGTGKELVARLIHNMSQRLQEPFVPVHCGALPETLMESELFGYEKGAFTNADKQKPGRFDLAGSGTLFFDEVSEMSLTTQVKILRVIQEKEFMRVGGTRVLRTNARILAASNIDLRAAVEAGSFRNDLFFRLSVVPVQLPPLRDRMEDIPLLARHYLRHNRKQLGAVAEDFHEDTLALMYAYAWPGNIRELRNVVERMLVLNPSEKEFKPHHLPDEFQMKEKAPLIPFPTGRCKSLSEAVDLFERDLVLQALREAEGVQTKAAQLLGTTRRILKYRMDKLSITSP